MVLAASGNGFVGFHVWRGDGGIFEETVHSPFKFFSADPAYAWEVARVKGRGIGNVMKVFLKMDHPLDLTTAAGLAKAYQIFDVPVEDERIAELKDDRKRIAASPLDTKTTYIKYEGNTPVAQSSVPKPGHSAEHFEFVLIDKLPQDTPYNVRDQLRRYLESMWIAKTGASLNVRRNYTVSFGGGTLENRKRKARSGSA